MGYPLQAISYHCAAPESQDISLAYRNSMQRYGADLEQIVDLDAVGSNPITRPSFSFKLRRFSAASLRIEEFGRDESRVACRFRNRAGGRRRLGRRNAYRHNGTRHRRGWSTDTARAGAGCDECGGSVPRAGSWVKAGTNGVPAAR